MSRIGRTPVEVPGGVNVELSDRNIKVTGPRGELTVPVGRGVRVEQEDGNLLVRRNSDAPPDRAMHGLTRSLLQNAVTGVTDGFTRTLNIAGVGYRAALQGRDINLQVGYSHPVAIAPREGIEFEVPNATTIIVRGNDKQQGRPAAEGVGAGCPTRPTLPARGNDKQRVGQMAAEIRKVRPPEPYKGKGIRYSDEQVRRKVGKAGEGEQMPGLGERGGDGGRG